MIEYALNKNDGLLKRTREIVCEGAVWSNGYISLSNGRSFIVSEAFVDYCSGNGFHFHIPGEYSGFANAVGHILKLCPGLDQYPRLTIKHDRRESYYVFLTEANKGVAFSGSMDAADGPWARPWDDGLYEDKDLLGVGINVDAKCAKMVAVCKNAKEAME